MNLKFKDKNIEKFIAELRKKIKHLEGVDTSVQIQSYLSDHCGFYAVAFVSNQDQRVQEQVNSFLSRFQLSSPTLENGMVAVE